MMSGGRENDERGKQLVVVSSASLDSSPAAAAEASHIYCAYPPPLAKYEDVARDPKLFMETLVKLHEIMGTKFMVPIIGGKELDLHHLFVEVTSRGGLEKVIRDRRWRDVTATFSFPSTATNASFVLRKYYISLIQHYEQIYFFGSKGWTLPNAAPLQTATTTVPAHGLVAPALSISEVRAASHKRRSTGEGIPSRASLPTGCPVIGVINGKFEYGYLVTVTVGSEKLQGVLYHTSEFSMGQVQQQTLIANNSANDVITSGTRRRRRRKKSEMRKRDPSHPKPNRSGYNFFFAEQHARLKALHPGKDREMSRMIGDLWNKLSETQRAVYQEKGLKDKERYKSEMEVYRQRLRTGQIIRNAVPIQQRLAVPEVVLNTEFKTEVEESGLPETTGNENSSEESDSEEVKVADKDSDAEESFPASTGRESVHLVGEPSVNGDGYALQTDRDGGMEIDDASESMTKDSTD